MCVCINLLVGGAAGAPAAAGPKGIAPAAPAPAAVGLNFGMNGLSFATAGGIPTPAGMPAGMAGEERQR